MFLLLTRKKFTVLRSSHSTTSMQNATYLRLPEIVLLSSLGRVKPQRRQAARLEDCHRLKRQVSTRARLMPL